MSFNSANLSPSGQIGGTGNNLPGSEYIGWKYTTPDNLSVVAASGYFNNAGYSSFRAGDYIAVEANDGNELYLVDSVGGEIGSAVVSIDSFVGFASLPTGWV